MDEMTDVELEGFARKLMEMLSTVGLELRFTGVDLADLAEHARRIYTEWAAYRVLGVAGVRRDGRLSVPVPGPATSHEQQFVADVAEMLGRPEDADLDVLRHDLAERLNGDRRELAKLHYPVGPFHEPCDQGRYGDEISNPACTHRHRACHECHRTWPCATAKLFDVHGWFDPDSIDECIPLGWRETAAQAAGAIAELLADPLDGGEAAR